MRKLNSITLTHREWQKNYLWHLSKKLLLITTQFTDSRLRCRNPTRTVDIMQVDRWVPREWIEPKTPVASLTCSSMWRIPRPTETWLMECSLELSSPVWRPSWTDQDMESLCLIYSNFDRTCCRVCEQAVEHFCLSGLVHKTLEAFVERKREALRRAEEFLSKRLPSRIESWVSRKEMTNNRLRCCNL